MAMKRRSFLGMISGAIAAPLMPAPALGGVAAKAAYSRSMLHAAIFHAKSRVAFSVWGLAATLNIPLAQAEALMADLGQKGVLGPLEGATYGGRWAKSNVMEHTIYHSAPAAQAVGRASTVSSQKSTGSEPDLRLLWAHVQRLCVKQGFALSPRCTV